MNKPPESGTDNNMFISSTLVGLGAGIAIDLTRGSFLLFTILGTLFGFIFGLVAWLWRNIDV
jgi:F0F1-type ATP synthase assembly protein I